MSERNRQSYSDGLLDVYPEGGCLAKSIMRFGGGMMLLAPILCVGPYILLYLFPEFIREVIDETTVTALGFVAVALLFVGWFVVWFGHVMVISGLSRQRTRIPQNAEQPISKRTGSGFSKKLILGLLALIIIILLTNVSFFRSLMSDLVINGPLTSIQTPTQTPTSPSISCDSGIWKYKVMGISGTRAEIWERYVKVQAIALGISWLDYKEDVLAYNRILKTDGLTFKSDKEYCLPVEIKSQ